MQPKAEFQISGLAPTKPVLSGLGHDEIACLNRDLQCIRGIFPFLFRGLHPACESEKRAPNLIVTPSPWYVLETGDEKSSCGWLQISAIAASPLASVKDFEDSGAQVVLYSGCVLCGPSGFSDGSSGAPFF